jgi:tRNA A-37 threonylcarbamoyl transferase component Bud32
MSQPPEHDPDRTEPIPQEGRRVFGRYVLLEIVGEGGMGVVWRARDEKLEREVALKFLPERVRRDPEAIRELKRETRRCLELTHPNIVRVYDFVEDKVAAAIAMEYVPGKSLSALKAARPGGCFDAADLLPLLRQICDALDYAHKKARVVHRDLKPANLLVTDKGVLKVADFGIARSLRDTHSRQTGEERGASGTLAFMGPQQLESKGKPAPEDDIYALGATLYDLLTGKPPFFGADIFTEIRVSTPAPLAERRAELENSGAPIPAEWERMVLACLAKRAEARPRSAGAALAMLAEPQGSGDTTAKLPVERETVEPSGATPVAVGGVRAQTEKPWKIGRSVVRRRRWISWAAGVLVGAAVATVVAVLWPGGEEDTGLPPLSDEEAKGFLVIVDPPDTGAHLWIGTHANIPVPPGGRALLRGLPDGELELSVQAPGFHAINTRVRVKNGRGVEEVKLVAIRGAVEVVAREGTVVTAVDARGQETRVGTVPAGGVLSAEHVLMVGAYTLRFVHPDCVPVEQRAVAVQAGQVTKLTPTQQALPGSLRVLSVPAGAEVLINGSRVGATPATIPDQPSETPLVVEVRARGYRRLTQTLTLRPRERRTLDVGTLVAGGTGSIALRLAPAEVRLDDIKVKIDGRSAEWRRSGVGAPARIDNLEAGARAVEIAHPDYEPWQQEVAVREEDQTLVEATLRPRPGRLILRTVPKEIALTVNGRAVRPDELETGAIALPAGEPLELVASAKGYKSSTRTVTLPANGEETWEVALTKLAVAGPAPGQPWENSLGMKFVPVPGTAVLFCIWETRVRDFEAFVQATSHQATAGMYSDRGDGWKQQGDTWRSPGFRQGPTHPVVGVNEADAQAFCRWLTEKERAEGRLEPTQAYRLPRDAEWDAAVGREKFPWGGGWPVPRGAGNYADETARRGRFRSWPILNGYNDGFEATAPVGSFPANRHGIYDLGGNVWERVGDRSGGLRGGSFSDSTRDDLVSAARNSGGDRGGSIGFRVVLTVGAAP